MGLWKGLELLCATEPNSAWYIVGTQGVLKVLLVKGERPEKRKQEAKFLCVRQHLGSRGGQGSSLALQDLKHPDCSDSTVLEMVSLPTCCLAVENRPSC